MNNRKKKFALVIFLVIEQFVLLGRGDVDSEAGKIASGYWYSAIGFKENLTEENFNPPAKLSPSAIDSLEEVVANNPSIFRLLNDLVSSSDRKISTGAKLALSELSLIFDIPKQELSLIRETAGDVFESRPSRINAYYAGMLGDLGKNEDFRANAKNANQGDKRYYQEALLKSALRRKFYETSAYPVLFDSATDEQIEVRKLLYGSSFATQDSYFDWRRRAASLSEKQIEYGVDIAKQSNGVKRGFYKLLGVLGNTDKLPPELVDKIVGMAKFDIRSIDPHIREAVAGALRAVGTKEAENLLFSMLDDPEFHVRNGAYYGLKNMGVKNPPRIKGPEVPKDEMPANDVANQNQDVPKPSPKIQPDASTPEPTFAKKPPTLDETPAKAEAVEPASDNPFPYWIFIIGGVVVVGLVVVLKRK